MPHHSAIAVIPRGLAPLTPGLLVVAPTVLVAAMFRPVAVRTWSALLAGTSRLFRHERAAIPMETTGGGTDAFLNGSYGVDRGSPPRGDRQPKHGKIDTPGCPMRPNAYACDANTVSPPLGGSTAHQRRLGDVNVARTSPPHLADPATAPMVPADRQWDGGATSSEFADRLRGELAQNALRALDENGEAPGVARPLGRIVSVLPPNR